MDLNEEIGNLGESYLIRLIKTIISKNTGKDLILDDSFFFPVEELKPFERVVLNSDMLVSTTDVPKQMSYFQIGRKAIIMNISDLIVKGVKPRAMAISLGLPRNLLVEDFKQMIQGIVDVAQKWKIDYIGGDLNQSKELIINPTVFGFKNYHDIIYRAGMKQGDILASNGQFGLTGVGLHILIQSKESVDNFTRFKPALNSVLEPNNVSKEGLILAENHMATASIDSSDGLAKSLLDLMISNPKKGFEVDLTPDLVTPLAYEYARQYNINLEELVFNGGEEFIHLFTIDSKRYDIAKNLIRSKGGTLIKIGRVISDDKIFLVKNSKRVKLECSGYDHFM